MGSYYRAASDGGRKWVYNGPPLDKNIATAFSNEFPDAYDSSGDATTETASIHSNGAQASDGDYIEVEFYPDTARDQNLVCVSIRVRVRVVSSGEELHLKVFPDGEVFTVAQAASLQTYNLRFTPRPLRDTYVQLLDNTQVSRRINFEIGDVYFRVYDPTPPMIV